MCVKVKEIDFFISIYSMEACASTPSRMLCFSSDSYMLEIQQYKCKTHGFRTFTYFWPCVWNSLPQDIRQCSSLPSFKTKLKTFRFFTVLTFQLTSVATSLITNYLCMCVCVRACVRLCLREYVCMLWFDVKRTVSTLLYVYLFREYHLQVFMYSCKHSRCRWVHYRCTLLLILLLSCAFWWVFFTVTPQFFVWGFRWCPSSGQICRLFPSLFLPTAVS